jgi:hypothetical protein
MKTKLFALMLLLAVSCTKEKEPVTFNINGVKWCTTDYTDSYYSYDEAIKLVPNGYKIPDSSDIKKDMYLLLSSTGYMYKDKLWSQELGFYWIKNGYVLYIPNKNDVMIVNQISLDGRFKLRLIKK